MNKGQKKILIIIIIFLLIVSVLAVMLSLKKDEEKKPPKEPPKIEIGYEIGRLTNEGIFFNIQNTINNYYINLSNKKNERIYKILEEEYRNSLGITKYNASNIIYSNYETVNYVATNIYYNKFSSITYYFVSGYLFNLSMVSDSYEYYKNTCFLIIFKDGEYVLKPLGVKNDIKTYAENYNIKDLNINSNEDLSKINISEKNKLTMYINEFLNLLYLDTKEAYDMLDDITKSQYLNYYDFESQIDNIYQNLSPNIFAYSVKENKDNLEYRIKDKSQRSIVITEYKVMDYRIGY